MKSLKYTDEQLWVVGVVDYIYVLVAELANDAMDARAFHAYACAYRVNAVVIAFHGNLGAFARDAGHGTDADEAVVYFRDFKLEKTAHELCKNGLNIKLASMLTGYTIDVYRDTEESFEEDIYLDEFKDEIDGWVIDTLKNIGCVTAKSVLNTPRETLVEKSDLEEDTIDNLIRVLKAEFEDQ